MSAKTCTVYGLYDPLGELRYVGQSAQPLWKRLADHVAHANPTASRPVLRWLWDVYSAGGTVLIAPLKLNATLNSDERDIIKALLAKGCPLLNVEHSAAKGDITRKIFANDPELRRRHAEISRALMTPEKRAKISATMKGVPKSAEHRAKIGEGRRRFMAERSIKRNADGTYC